MNKIYIENSTLGFTVLKKLVRLGIRNSVFPFDGSFTKEELDSIEDLTLTSQDYLNGIENLKNLKRLCLLGNTESLVEDVNTDFSIINELTSLESLHIIESESITELDVSNLYNLKSLRLLRNENLTKIYGLSELKNLEESIICGNNITDFDNVIDYINNTKNTKINILDVIMFHKLFGIDLNNKEYLEERIASQYSNITFGEMLYFDNECFELNYYQMNSMYNKAFNILSELGIDDNQEENVSKIYNYIVTNLSYDHSGLDERSELYNHKELFQDKNNEYFKRRMLVINSSFSAIVNKKSVCDGYVNMMRLLLNMCDIESKKVLCSFHDSNQIKPEHVIIKFKLNDKWYYADPEKDQQNKEPQFFMKNLEEIQETHRLSTIEVDKYNKVLKKEK